MDSEDLKFAAPFVSIVILALLGFAGIVSAAYAFIDRPSCYATWRDSEFQARWSFWGGCQLSRDGRVWAPAADAYVTTLRGNVQVQQ